MQIHASVRSAAMVSLIAVAMSSPAAEHRRPGDDRGRAVHEREGRDAFATESLSGGEGDPRLKWDEEGCVDGRVLDYLQRHGDHGYIDPQWLLDTTRAMKNELDRERHGPRSLSIGGTVWTNIGPTNGAGRLTAVATHPTVAGTIIVGAAGGGAWKSIDSGASWTPLTETIANLSVGAIAYAPGDPTKVYLATGEAGAGDSIPGIGLLYSTDGGVNWTLPTSVDSTRYYRISVNPANPNDVIVGTPIGARRSLSGLSATPAWTTVIRSLSAGATIGYGDVTDIVRDPSNGQTLYASTWDEGYWSAKYTNSDPYNFSSSTILKSTDGGATWNPSATGFPVSTATQLVTRISLAISPSSPQVLYASTTIYNGSGDTTYVYMTTNGGASWSNTALSADPNVNSIMGQQATYDNAIVVAPADPNTVIVGGVTYAKTTNGGVNWTKPAFGGTGGFPHVDVHDLRYDAGGTLYFANDGGLWTSADHGVTTVNRNANLVTRQFYALSVDPVNRNRIFGGQQDNGTVFRPDVGGSSWNYFHHSDGFQSAVNDAAPSVAFATTQNATVARTRRAGIISPTMMVTTPPYLPSDSKPFFSVIKIDPSNPAVIYTVTDRVWKSTSGGDSWTPLPTTATGAAWNTYSISTIAIAKSNPQILMVGKNSTIFRSIDGGANWVGQAMANGLSGAYVLHIEIDPTDPNKAYAAFAGQSGTSVYYTLNGGTNWTARGTGLPGFSAQVVRIDPTDVNTIYCGTDVGVYRSTDGGANWSRFGTGMPAVSIYDLQATQDGAILRAASHGRGIWELAVPSIGNSLPTAAISAPATTQTIAKGATLTFTGTFSDPDIGDSATATWFFPDAWSTNTASSGASVSHTFNKAGRFPVTLVATDTHGAKAGAVVDVVVPEDGESCASPVVIPPTGPFPFTLTFNTEESTGEPTDPVPSCQGFTPNNGLWVSFTPSVSATFYVSACGSKAATVISGYTGNACGTYTPIVGMCLKNYSPNVDCALDASTSFAATAGTTYRFLVNNVYYNESGAISLTINQGSATFSPAVISISPSVGSGSGGTPVTITGSGFLAGAAVAIGGVAATAVNVITPQILTAMTGPHAPGLVGVTVTNPAAATATTPAAFTYVTAVNPTPPAALVATAQTATSIGLTWVAATGATQYEIWRASNGASSTLLTTLGVVTSFTDSTVTGGRAYVYRARALFSASPSTFSNSDLATTVIFTDDVLVATTTRVKAVHLTELRTAVNAVRITAGLAATTWVSDPVVTAGTTFIRKAHIEELRNALTPALTGLGFSAPPFTDPTLVLGGVIKAAHVQELRNAVK